MSPVNDLIVAAEVVEDESEPYGGSQNVYDWGGSVGWDGVAG